MHLWLYLEYVLIPISSIEYLHNYNVVVAV